MPRTLCSNLTFFWKVIFPVLWIPGLGLHILLAFTGHHWFLFTPREKWFFLALWPLGCIYYFSLPIIRLKRVRMDGEFLYISN
jgi:hypothetical protein